MLLPQPHDSVDADGNGVSEYSGYDRKLGGIGFFIDDAGGFKVKGRLDLVDEKRGGGALGSDYAAIKTTLLNRILRTCTRFLQAHRPGQQGEPIGRGVLAPATLAQMGQPAGWLYGQPIWGLGAMLYADNRAGGFIVGHDGSNEPAINTAARLNPATGNGIVILQTGDPLLATRLAGDWVFWEAGRVDFLAFKLAMLGMLRWLGWGSAAIALLVPSVAWGMRRRRQRRGSE